MLNNLTIKNIALIEHLALELSPGLTIMTGETGAGKSIILDALSLVLGRRADSSLIRSGTDKAMVTACFQLRHDHPAMIWLSEKDLESGEELLTIRRTIGAKTPSRAYINETAVPLVTLAELGSQLVEIHGQHDHQILLNSNTHLTLLDAFANHGDLLAQVESQFKRWNDLHTELENLKKMAAEAFERRDYLAFQLQELEGAGIAPGELVELESHKARLAHAKQLVQNSQTSIDLLSGVGGDDRGGASTLTNQAAFELEGAGELDSTLLPLAEAVRSLHYEMDDIIERIGHYMQSLEIDPAQLDEVEERLDLIHRLSRKHHIEADELEPFTAKLRREMETIDHADERIATVEKELDQVKKSYTTQAGKLSASRKKASKQLVQAVEKQLSALHMKNTRLSINISAKDGDPRANGMEDGTFLVSTNPGESPKPLKQVASGGELSRIMLALKTVLADLMTTTTLIFDEVDVGVGGRVAASIGEKLAHVASDRQVMAITHLPQVAAWGRNHLKVEKKSHKDKTQASITPLNNKERIEELARMLAGNRVTAPARQNAKDLLLSCKNTHT
jgi:DNA repair protein RecN (Recombination protein N)